MNATCDTCGAPVIWCRTETGKRMPVDTQPAHDGNLRLTDPDSALPTARPASRGGDSPLHRSHFASCPDASHHRRRDRSERHTTTPVAPTGTDLFGSRP